MRSEMILTTRLKEGIVIGLEFESGAIGSLASSASTASAATKWELREQKERQDNLGFHWHPHSAAQARREAGADTDQQKRRSA